MRRSFKYFLFLLILASCSENQEITTQVLANMSSYKKSSKLLLANFDKLVLRDKEQQGRIYDHLYSDNFVILSCGEAYFKNAVVNRCEISELKPILKLWHNGLLAGGFNDLIITNDSIIIYQPCQDPNREYYVIYKENSNSKNFERFRFDDLRLIDKNLWYGSTRKPLFDYFWVLH
jgi:hypothetical protein